MRNNDTIPTREELRATIQQCVRDNDVEGFARAFEQMQQRIADDLQQDFDEHLEEIRRNADAQALAARGVRQLTSEERSFYQRFIECAQAKDPKQALTNANLVLPITTINAVFDDLRTNHPLLSHINFIPTGGAIKMVLNTNGRQSAAWGDLCDEIVQELLSGFSVLDTNLCKLSAFLPVCKQALILGPEWMDRYVREVLYEAFANGMTAGILDGTGKKQPIGMTRQVGPGTVVTDGVYPRKAAITVNSLDLQTVGGLIGLIAPGPNGAGRAIRDLILVCNPADYYTKVVPATMLMAPDGSYRSALPYSIEIIQDAGISIGKAVFGLGYRYAAFLGSDEDGNIEYSDHARFLLDQRVYVIKGFANGLPLDGGAFLYLDISSLAPLSYKVELVDSRTPSNDATLASLKIGSLTLSPTFAAGTTSYTASTSNASNIVTAEPADAGASVAVVLNGTAIPNGSAAAWSSANSGVNELVITVTAEDGTTTKAYTVTVTKS